MISESKRTLIWILVIVIGICAYFYFKTDSKKKPVKAESPEYIATSQELFANLLNNPMWDIDSRLALKNAVYNKSGKENVKGISVDEVSDTIYIVGIDLEKKSINVIYQLYWNSKSEAYWKIEELDSEVLRILNNRYKIKQAKSEQDTGNSEQDIGNSE